MMLFRANLYAFVASYILFVNGQAAPLTVVVAPDGNFSYNPPIVSAEINRTIIFQFSEVFLHSVTQSSFDAPCSPLGGGFDSGVVDRRTNWSLTINDSSPIWYFCSTGVFRVHCAARMVGAINPPSIQMYNQFVSAAKVGPPAPTAEGVFATPAPDISLPITSSAPLNTFATQAPSAFLLPITSSALTTTSTLSSTSSAATSTPSPTATAVSSSTSHLGAIIEGTVGGTVALIGLIFML
ncbi:hypothetical protein BYT27DRAFT_6510811 [Phlegmacium glaucopus]|nr:hypothetical protein BYT27DRAFT_6510811 [Phlegmacium glaucopus]